MHTHKHTHTQKHASPHSIKHPHWFAWALWRIQSQHTSAGLFYGEHRKWAVIHSTRAVSTFQVSRSCLPLCSIHTYGWPNLSVLLQYKAQSVSLFGSLAFFSSSSSTSSLTCSDTTGFLQTFRFSLFAFWWGDTWHIVESNHPGGILIEEKHEWVRRGNRERLKQCRETGWDKGEVKMRDCHRKK